MHPQNFHPVKIHGKEVLTPRWQQAYGANYRYTGSLQNALPIPMELTPFQKWSQDHIDLRLNGLLLNWYDGAQKHYIGAHRDDGRDLVDGSPIVTISIGEERYLRMGCCNHSLENQPNMDARGSTFCKVQRQANIHHLACVSVIPIVILGSKRLCFPLVGSNLLQRFVLYK